MKEFNFSHEVNLSQLNGEIADSMITVAIESIYIEGGMVHINFKADLSEPESIMLTSIVDAHVALPYEEDATKVQLSKVTDTDGIPYVYSTSKPLNHYVCFQGADDITEEPHPDGSPHIPHFSEPKVTDIGKGEKLTFRLTSTMSSTSKDFMFNQNVYVKDGYIITKDAPFGATLDIDIIHPLYGLLFPFGRAVPVFGTGWFTMDTEDRGYLPQGLIIRITVNNASGSETILDEEPPATFNVFGRFELYRPKPPGT